MFCFEYFHKNVIMGCLVRIGDSMDGMWMCVCVCVCVCVYYVVGWVLNWVMQLSIWHDYLLNKAGKIQFKKVDFMKGIV